MKNKKIYLLIVSLLIFVMLIPGSLSSAANMLFDGGFEQYPQSSWWYLSEPIGGVFMNSTLNTQFVFDRLVMPDPLCGHGIYNVGKTTYPLDYRNGSVPSYQFTWQGGTFYWQAAVLGPWFRSFFPMTAYSYADIYLIDAQNSRIELLNNYQIAYGAPWERKYGSMELTAGTYTLYLGRGSSMEKTDAYFYKYQLFYDDVYVGTSEPAHNVCSDSPIEATPTFEPTQYAVSPTPYVTSTMMVTATPVPQDYYLRSLSSKNDGYGVMMCEAGDRLVGVQYDLSSGGSTNLAQFHGADLITYQSGYGPHAWWYQDGYQAPMIANGLQYGTELVAWTGNFMSDGLCGYGDNPSCSGDFNNITHWGGNFAHAYFLCYGTGLHPTPSPTPTVTPTGPTPTLMPSLGNCGFEAGDSYWYVTPPSYVALEGGPAGPQNGVALPNDQGLPDIWQNFYWPTTQAIYMQGWSKGQTQVRVWNINVNFEFKVLYTGDDADWVHWQSAFTLPMGFYRVELNTFLPAGSEGRFDGITLAANDYLNDALCSIYTPTPGPTSYVTPTPGPSLTPSRTMTPRTSRTPWGTPTLWPTGTASLTVTPANGATGTAQASITPGAGGGGGSTQTPGPGDFVPPDQPPGGEGAPCQRPQSWTDSLNLGWWMDYETCDIKRFLSWGPVAQETAQAIPTMFARKEPFKTIGDISSSVHGMQTQVASYSWDQTGFSGVDSTPVNPSPDKILNNNLASGGVPQDPWAAGGIISFSQTPNPNFFSVICTSRLSNMLSARLAEGLCFALNVTKGIGYLGWVSFLTNCGLVFLIIREFLSIINYYGQYVKPVSVSASGITEIAKGEEK